MRTLRILMTPASVVLFSGTLIAVPGCGSSQPEQIVKPDDPAISQSRDAREAFAKSQKKETTRRATGRGTDPRG
ncbi:MAG: hypothetical protein BGO49_14730 [Planctomycetales bacterium 71-10]|mgnify:CR=1 FL=1|nr:MAG: hypothetical protein BGO49_14730 [Planctomycetales bacterium 71-10]